MASHLNQLFQVAPQGYLERTVLFSDSFATPENQAAMRNKLVHHVDIEPVNTRSRTRLLAGMHDYFRCADMPMVSYVVPLFGVASVAKKKANYDLVFMPEFTCGRLLIEDDGEWLKLSLERNLITMLPPPENDPDSRFCDSVNYWEFVAENRGGNVRATAVVFRERGRPWRFAMQQIAGHAGAEVVHKLDARDLRYRL